MGIERQLSSALGKLSSFFFCRWSQEHNCGNFPHLPFPFPFSVVLFQSPFSQSSEWWDYDPEMGSLLIFQFLHFLFQLREASEALDFVSHGHYYFFPPSTRLMPTAFQMLEKELVRLPSAPE